jgi:DHA2 family multidrug resistance protein
MDPRWIPLVVTTIGAFMSFLDTNIVNIALPTILRDFNASLSSGQLVVGCYVMALGVVIPLSGYLGERIGMKKLYMITLGAFVAGSALCGLAWNIESLIFFRILQGLGGGFEQPLGMAIVFTMITPLERPKFLALLGLPTLVAPILGPTLGGYIVEYASWRWVFFINVPVGLIDIVLAYFLLKETEVQPQLKLDKRGFLLSSIAFPTLLFGLSNGAETEWSSVVPFVLIAVGLLALGAFIAVENSHEDPMLRLTLFNDRNFRLAAFVQWIGIFSLFGLNFILPLFLQSVRGMDAAETGRVLIPMGIVAFITMNVAGKLYYRTGPRPLIISGLLCLALTTAAWSQVHADTSALLIMIVVAGRGLGLGLFSQIVQVVAYNTVPDGQLSRATSLVNVGQRMNSAFSTAILTTVLVVALAHTGAPAGSSIVDGTAPISNMLESFQVAFLIMTAMSLVGVVIAWFIRDPRWEEHRGLESHDAGELLAVEVE